MRVTASTVLGLSVCALALGAPGVKEKAGPDKPESDQMYADTTDNLKRLALGMHNYEAVYLKFPGNHAEKGQEFLSWRVQILPYLEVDEYVELYKQFKLDEPWDSDHNKKLIDRRPKIYAPLRGKATAGETFYQSFRGKDSFLRPGGLAIAAITDGTSNTLMLAEADKPVVWTKPDDIPFDGKAAPALGGMFKDHFFAAFADGSVRSFPKNLGREALVAVITTHGGEVVDLDAAVEAAGKK